jgi:hypothetical protein
MGASLRRRVSKFKAEQSAKYRVALDDWEENVQMYAPQVRVCQRKCLGLPEGTRLFQVNVPVSQLQVAEINGELKLVSALYHFR